MNQRQLFLQHVAQTSDNPLMGVDVNIVSANGATLTDINGKKYIDLISGISVSNVGHCHPKVVKAINEQTQKFMHLMVYGEFNQSPQVKYATTLLPLLPKNLNSIYYTTGGSESIEGAMKLAKRVTGKSEIISFKKSYHGSTQGALSLMGDEYFKNAYRPLLPNTKQLTFNDLNELSEITDKTSAVVVELIQAESGITPANINFIEQLRNKCTQHNALLIIDEIQTGFGRTGTLFAFEKYKVEPDILCIAKGMGGGLPIGAFIANKTHMGCFTNQPVLGHINTFGGNAVCLAAAQACLEIIIDDELVANSIKIGKIISDTFSNINSLKCTVVGAFAALEFNTQLINFEIIKQSLLNGIITDWFLFNDKALRICPPLNINETELKNTLQKLAVIISQVKTN
jgi:acetylornithine/N-succinyldiaminopimelate aminotransferase